MLRVLLENKDTEIKELRDLLEANRIETAKL
jgi:hypothetical protein